MEQDDFVADDFQADEPSPKKAEVKKPDSKARSLFKKAVEKAYMPKEAAQRGINQLADFIPEPIEPTGNLPLDIALGAPSILSKALVKSTGRVASEAVDPLSLLTAGAAKGIKYLKPGIKAVGKTIGKGLEALSGLEHKTPGVLGEAVQNPGLMFSRGKEFAGKAFDVAKNALGKTASITDDVIENKGIIDKATELAKAGKLDAADAHTARKAIDSLRGSKAISAEALTQRRKIFDAIVKANKQYEKADKLYQKAVKGEALRSLLPQNKYGGASAFKTGIASVALPISPLFSPLVQGLGASSLGVLKKAVSPFINSPSKAYAASAMRNILKERQKGKK